MGRTLACREWSGTVNVKKHPSDIVMMSARVTKTTQVES